MLNKLKRDIIVTAYNAGDGHIPSALSCVGMIWNLYETMQPEDKFILSKGHGALALYVVLAEKGIITRDELNSFCSFDSNLGGHPDANKIPEAVVSTGSLGHGLPMGIGMALAKKIKEEDGIIYVLLCDGECNEGSIWESALLIKHLKLDNIVCYIDNNQSSAINLSGLNGMLSVFSNNFIALKMIKGDGVSMMEKNPAKWHHGIPNKEELDEILKELE